MVKGRNRKGSFVYNGFFYLCSSSNTTGASPSHWFRMNYFFVFSCFFAVLSYGFPLRNGNVTPFKIHFPEDKVAEMLQLIGLGKLPQPTYEGTNPGFGVTDEWLAEAKQTWLTFDWYFIPRDCCNPANHRLKSIRYRYKKEDELNSIPQFLTTVKDRGGTDFKIHFAALLSENPAAQPLVLLHGWPGKLQLATVRR